MLRRDPLLHADGKPAQTDLEPTGAALTAVRSAPAATLTKDCPTPAMVLHFSSVVAGYRAAASSFRSAVTVCTTLGGANSK